MSHLSNNFMPLSHNLKMPNPYLSTQSYEDFVNILKTITFEHYFCQYLKNNIFDIKLIPLDHVTCGEVCPSRLP